MRSHGSSHFGWPVVSPGSGLAQKLITGLQQKTCPDIVPPSWGPLPVGVLCGSGVPCFPERLITESRVWCEHSTQCTSKFEEAPCRQEQQSIHSRYNSYGVPQTGHLAQVDNSW